MPSSIIFNAEPVAWQPPQSTRERVARSEFRTHLSQEAFASQTAQRAENTERDGSLRFFSSQSRLLRKLRKERKARRSCRTPWSAEIVEDSSHHFAHKFKCPFFSVGPRHTRQIKAYMATLLGMLKKNLVICFGESSIVAASS